MNYPFNGDVIAGICTNPSLLSVSLWHLQKLNLRLLFWPQRILYLVFFYQPLVTEITRSQDMENRITNSNARSCNNPSFTHWCIVTYLIQGRQSRCAALSYPCISHAHAWLYSAPVLRSPGRQRSSVTNSLTFSFFSHCFYLQNRKNDNNNCETMKKGWQTRVFFYFGIGRNNKNTAT